MAPDSWAFWQGSVSLLDQRGYRLFAHSQPIKEWPPLYPFYLAAWQAVFGVSGAVLGAAQNALSGLATIAWTRLAHTLTWLDSDLTHGRGRCFWLAGSVQATFIGIFIATRYDCVRADNLKYVLLPLLIAVCERTWFTSDRAEVFRACTLIGVLGMLLVLTHTSSMAFVGAAMLIVLMAKNTALGARIAGVSMIGSVTLIPWLISRSVFEQSGSHQLGLGVATYPPFGYAVQALGGSCTLLIKQPWLAGPLAVVLTVAAWLSFDRDVLSERIRGRLKARLVFVAGAVVILFALFNVTHITDKLTGRFVFFVPLSLVPAAVALLARTERPWPLLAASGLTLLAAIPRLLDLSHGVLTSQDGLSARPEQTALAGDCIRRADSLRSWKCSEGTRPRLPPPDPELNSVIGSPRSIPVGIRRPSRAKIDHATPPWFGPTNGQVGR